VAVLLALLLVGCGDELDTGPADARFENPGRQVKVKQGQRFDLVLKDLDGSGGSWTFGGVDDGGVLEYRSSEDDPSAPVGGSGPPTVFHFEAKEVGTATASFQYSGPDPTDREVVVVVSEPG